MGLGLLLVLGVGAFFIYAWRASTNLSNLEVPEPTTAPSTPVPLPSTLSGEASLRFSPEVIAAQRMFPGEAIPPLNWPNPMETEAGYATANPPIGDFAPIPSVRVAPWHSLPVPRITPPTSFAKDESECSREKFSRSSA